MAGDFSIHTGMKREFGILDYILFSLLFVLSAAIGIYHAYRDRKNFDVKHFHLGGRQMHPLLVSFSLVATFLSALTVIGVPAEIYTYGTMYIWLNFGMFVATAGAAHVFLPIFYHLNTTSCFSYLQLRYGTVIRLMVSIMFILQTLLYMGFILYVPSLSFQAVTGLSLWGTMIGVASVCTLYTLLGGMKTVLWTDSLQLIIMFAGLLTLLIMGSAKVGGFSKAWQTASEHGRIEFTDFSLDPRTRHSVWSLGIGGGIFWSYLYGVNQSQVQRQCSLPTLRRAQIAVWLNFPGLVLIFTLACLIGVVMYACYSECDPVKFGLVDKADQILPLMVLDVLGTTQGLAGIFMACVFSGSLSSMSSGLNAMSAIVTEDYFKYYCCKSLSGKRELMVSKLIVLVFGFVMFSVAAIISETDSLVILQLSYSLYAVLSGPMFGCFIVGMIFPWTNKHGALAGLITSLGLMSWLGFGALVNRPPGTKPLPVFTDGCNWEVTGTNFSITTVSSSPQSSLSTTSVTNGLEADEAMVDNFYRMSYQWYPAFGMLTNIVVSLIVSFITGYTDPSTINNKLMCPLFFKMFPCLPTKFRNYLYFGVNYENETSDKKPDEEVSLCVSSDKCKRKDVCV
ncbi:sodium-coupled monocarboxylate transporter 2-like [Mercenaria mercenaria]|uniref:sodium-coupled monocarboxylate transporter 2-like n=1 Tax=Mercenaria mercenaria TaxID=6596 RepID=UPI00234F443C|nr:sodium-coupled monocarboxylate transporter 2-like [Mercenaria mercenaria]